MRQLLAAALLSFVCALSWAQTLDELHNNKNTDHVPNFGMGNDLKMWSPLRQINKSNVKRLAPVWHFSTANNNGELSQPTVYNGVMYVVNAEWTFAIDIATGEQIWRTPVNYDRGATWQSASYDAELDLVYIGTGNAEPYNPKYRDGMASLCTTCVLALRPKTGEIAWYYQTIPNDSFDFDANAEWMIADLRVEGQMRKVQISAHKGVQYVSVQSGKGGASAARYNQNVPAGGSV